MLNRKHTSIASASIWAVHRTWALIIFCGVVGLLLLLIRFYFLQQETHQQQQTLLTTQTSILDSLQTQYTEQAHQHLATVAYFYDTYSDSYAKSQLQSWWAQEGSTVFHSLIVNKHNQPPFELGNPSPNVNQQPIADSNASISCVNHSCYLRTQFVFHPANHPIKITALHPLKPLLDDFSELSGVSYALINIDKNLATGSFKKFYSRTIDTHALNGLNQTHFQPTSHTFTLPNDPQRLTWTQIPLPSAQGNLYLMTQQYASTQISTLNHALSIISWLFMGLTLALAFILYWGSKRFNRRMNSLTNLMPLMGEQQYQKVRNHIKTIGSHRWSGELNTLESALMSLSYTLESYEKAANQRDQEMERLSLFDGLTSLPNRSLLQFEIEHGLQDLFHSNKHTMTVLLLMDLDQFKRINDSLEHKIGDTILAIIAKRLKNHCHSKGIVARMGGDEFAILLRHMSDESEIIALAQKILELVQQPLQIHNTSLVLTCSVGAAVGSPKDSHGSLIKHAEIAMYESKQQGGNQFTLFNNDMASVISDNLSLEGEIRRAFQHEEFTLYFQPKVNMSGTIKGFEALIRWQHPTRGLLAPEEFIPNVEAMGFVTQLDNWVLDNSLKHIALFQEAHRDIQISVNITSTQFSQGEFFPFLQEALEKHDVNASRLELEITETLLMGNMNASQKVINRIKSLGVRIAIDDFGTGYSSLGYLKKLPVDTLKIDREFIKDIPYDASDKQITAAIIFLAKQLHLTVVAEGVETQAQLKFLRQNNCDLAQGFYFSKPVSAQQAIEMLNREQAFIDKTA